MFILSARWDALVTVLDPAPVQDVYLWTANRRARQMYSLTETMTYCEDDATQGLRSADFRTERSKTSILSFGCHEKTRCARTIATLPVVILDRSTDIDRLKIQGMTRKLRKLGCVFCSTTQMATLATENRWRWKGGHNVTSCLKNRISCLFKDDSVMRRCILPFALTTKYTKGTRARRARP